MGGEKIYSGGDIKSRHGLDVDMFGFLDLVDEVVKLDGVSWDNLHFKVPETSEFKELHDDTQVMDMISYVLKGSRFISVYVGNERVDGEVIRHMENNLDISTPCDGDYEFSDDSSVEGDDYNDMDESSDEDSDDGLLDVELASDDEEYIQARQNMKKQSTIEGGETIAHQDALKISRTTGKNILDAKKEASGVGDLLLSEYENSDGDINSESNSSENDLDVRVVKSRQKKVIYDPKCDHKSLKLEVGMRFNDPYQCKHALQSISLEHGYPLRFIRCNKKQCEARCTSQCKWRVYGNVVKKTGVFLIKVLSHRHTCPRDMYNKNATAKWIAREFLDTFRIRPDIKVKELQAEIMMRYACHVSKWRLYRAKWMALKKLRGSLGDHYFGLRSYVAELMRVDREGRFELLLGHDSIFKAIYIGFSALKKGFLKGCRSIIGLDGCFLKTILGGVLLCAIGKDGNNQMFPIAWAVVEIENQSCWTWFLTILLEELGINDGSGFTFISDQQKVT